MSTNLQVLKVLECEILFKFDLITELNTLERTIHIISAAAPDQLPGLDEISNIPRQRKLKIVFEESVRHLRKSYGEDLEKLLPDFQIAIHNTEHEINICKLITYEEIEKNQLFFLQCAKDYRSLGTALITRLIETKRITLNTDFPFLSLNKFKNIRRNYSGKVDDWDYFFHGYHCGFQHKKTKQKIEVPYMFGMEFGDLDPYFFSIFIKSTPEYQPLPIEIFDDFDDGKKILDVMLSLGYLEKIHSNIEHYSGTVVKDRDKVDIKVFNPETDLVKSQSKLSGLFSFLKF